jgi:membrane-bound lytic murein transglycosylase F
LSRWVTPSSKIEALVDLDSIVTRGKLIAVIENNSTDYFLYKGEPKGFQFEMLQELGNYLGLQVEILVNNDPSKNSMLLKNNECDIIANSLNSLRSNEGEIICSLPLLETELVLVQRKASDLLINADKVIRDFSELEGKSVYVPLQSDNAQMIGQLTNDMALKINVYEMPQYSQEKLIGLVALGEIDYTICNTLLAKSLRTIYPELDFETVVKKAEPIVWNFRRSSPALAQKINQWINEISGSTHLSILTEKYFNNREHWFPAEKSGNRIAEKISAYDEIIKKYSGYINWDWRLLASLIYQESRFKPGVKSKQGAWGLMQMMPATQSHFGIDTTASPEKQIFAGVRYIKYLDYAFADRIPDSEERIKFILASYNIGPGHIYDAQKIAVKTGKNPQKWFNNVDTCLLRKSQRRHYSDPDIQFGYCKGTETFLFVQEILTRFQHYKNVVSK